MSNTVQNAAVLRELRLAARSAVADLARELAYQGKSDELAFLLTILPYLSVD